MHQPQKWLQLSHSTAITHAPRRGVGELMRINEDGAAPRPVLCLPVSATVLCNSPASLAHSLQQHLRCPSHMCPARINSGPGAAGAEWASCALLLQLPRSPGCPCCCCCCRCCRLNHRNYSQPCRCSTHAAGVLLLLVRRVGQEHRVVAHPVPPPLLLLLLQLELLVQLRQLP